MEIRSVSQFLEYWANLRERTRRVALCIPPERLEWTHRAGAFTLGDLIRHLATIERYMYAETVAGRPSRYPGCGRELAEGYEAVLAYFDRLDTRQGHHRRAERRGPRAQVPDAGGHPITTWKWLRAMCEHEVHHRGQIYLMLGMLGVAAPPPVRPDVGRGPARSA